MAKCVKCGYCCTVTACYYGEWDQQKHQCKYLTEDKLCGIYDKVKGNQSTPAMGAGCSSTLFNEVREVKIRSMKNGN